MRNHPLDRRSQMRTTGVLLFVVLAILAECVSCSSSSPASQIAQPASQPLLALQNAATPQITPTYDGSGQITEPSIRSFDSEWNGYRYWLVVQPYPYGEDAYENPSMLVSNVGPSWAAQTG